MKRTFRDVILSFLTGTAFTLFFLSLAVVIVLNFRPLYYWDISFLQLEGICGLTAGEIRNNYDALITYNSPFFFGLLEFPDLPSSREALIHFAEVKQIFLNFYLTGILSFLAILILLPLQKKRGTLPFCLGISSLVVLLLPSLTGLAVALNFDAAFVLFHKLFFRNDFWLFDPVTDPIILLLPDTFFLQCAVLIILLVLLGALGLYLVFRQIKQRIIFL